MNRVKRIVAGAMIATAALTGVGGAANAAPAHAVSKSNCYDGYVGYSHNRQAVTWCYYRYDWIERTFMKGVNGWYYEYRAVRV